MKSNKYKSEIASELKAICHRKDAQIVRLKEKVNRIFNVELELQNLKNDYNRLKIYNEVLKMKSKEQKDELTQLLEENEKLRTANETPIKKVTVDIKYRERIEYLTNENKKLKQELYKKKDKDLINSQIEFLIEENKVLQEEVNSREIVIKEYKSNITKITEERNRYLTENARLIEERRVLLNKLKREITTAGCTKHKKVIADINVKNEEATKDETKKQIKNLQEQNDKFVDEINFLKEELSNKVLLLKDNRANEELGETIGKLKQENESLKLLLKINGSEINTSKVNELQETIKLLIRQNDELKLNVNKKLKVITNELKEDAKESVQWKARVKELEGDNKKLKESICREKRLSEAKIKKLTERNEELTTELNKLKADRDNKFTSPKQKSHIIAHDSPQATSKDTKEKSMKEIAEMLKDTTTALKGITLLSQVDKTSDNCSAIIKSGCLLNLLKIMTSTNKELIILSSNIVISILHIEEAFDLFLRCNGILYTLTLIVNI